MEFVSVLLACKINKIFRDASPTSLKKSISAVKSFDFWLSEKKDLNL